ncbi:MAG: DUF805 domain-containing protein [Streptococcaceae bacterium]|jgi:uncharacterized membrane protein YhaH (DUF805 family)|nr:DUF805 domain-containing protein [Streptococcaceae bacterium]
MVKINQTGKIGFGRAIKDFFTGYINFTGRTTRAGFWFACLFLALLFVPLLVLFGETQLVLQNIPSLSFNPTLFNPFLYLGFMLGIAVILPVFALLARRMRDTGMKNYSIALFLILFLIDKISGLAFHFLSNETANFSFFIVTFFFLLAFFVFSLTPSNYFLTEDSSRPESDLKGWSVTKQGKVSKDEGI